MLTETMPNPVIGVSWPPIAISKINPSTEPNLDRIFSGAVANSDSSLALAVSSQTSALMNAFVSWCDAAQNKVCMASLGVAVPTFFQSADGKSGTVGDSAVDCGLARVVFVPAPAVSGGRC